MAVCIKSSLARAPKHTVIVSHPDAGSLCVSVAERYRQTAEEQGHQVVVRDLYRMGFDPALKPLGSDFPLSDDVAAELALISGSDVFVLVYPIWFGIPPAMLKGYVDRVLGAGVSHQAVETRTFHPVMSGKRLLSITTSGASLAWLNEQAVYLALHEVFGDYLADAFSLAATEHVHFSSIERCSECVVHEQLVRVEACARQTCATLASCAHG